MSDTESEILDRVTFVLRPEARRARSAQTDLPDLSDDDFDAMTSDPAKITTHEQANAILIELDESIGNIQAQIDAYAIEAVAVPMAPDRQSWLHRAAMACGIKRSQRFRVVMRDRELRMGRRDLTQKTPEEQVAKAAKQERVKTDQELKKASASAKFAAAQAQIALSAERRALSTLFQAVAHERLETSAFDEIVEEAKRRRKFMLEGVV